MKKIKRGIAAVLLAITPKKLIELYRSHDFELARLSYLQTNNLEFAQFSYAQEGEDLVLARFLEKRENGFYIDVGAHHPKRFSNTYFFYKKGWRGITIDAMPGSMEKFKKDRPRDISVEAAISDKKQTLTYYLFNEPALNGFSEEISKQRDGNNGYTIISKKEMPTFTLAEVLSKNMPSDTQIDFMSIDVEGYDYEALTSNDWRKYRPTIVVIEDLEASLQEIESSRIWRFLANQGYEVCAKTYFSYFFIDAQNKNMPNAVSSTNVDKKSE